MPDEVSGVFNVIPWQKAFPMYKSKVLYDQVELYSFLGTTTGFYVMGLCGGGVWGKFPCMHISLTHAACTTNTH